MLPAYVHEANAVSGATTHIVHIERHSGWYTTTAEGDTFADAAQAAVVATCKRFGLDLDTIAHTVEFEDRPNTDTFLDELSPPSYQYVALRWAEPHRVFDPLVHGGWGMTKPGDRWFSERVREGAEGDCGRCGGTGVDVRNPFVRCRTCGEGLPSLERWLASRTDAEEVRS